MSKINDDSSRVSHYATDDFDNKPAQANLDTLRQLAQEAQGRGVRPVSFGSRGRPAFQEGAQ